MISIVVRELLLGLKGIRVYLCMRAEIKNRQEARPWPDPEPTHRGANLEWPLQILDLIPQPPRKKRTAGLVKENEENLRYLRCHLSLTSLTRYCFFGKSGICFQIQLIGSQSWDFPKTRLMMSLREQASSICLQNCSRYAT